MIESRFPQARWRGPVPNENPRGMIAPLYGLVLHVEQGSEAGTDAWFHEPGSAVSAHFGAPPADELGQPVPLDQWVEIGDRAWAEAGGNARWVSVETAGHASTEMDLNQLANIANLYAWLHQAAPDWFPFRTSNSPTEQGLGWHGMGGAAWGGHPDCPGSLRIAQRPKILAKAITLVHPTPAYVPDSPHPATLPYPGTVLKIGTSSPAVKELQEQLRARGWRITVDGNYDSATMHVVAEFQAEKHLRVDGEVGPVTWWALWHLPVTAP